MNLGERVQAIGSCSGDDPIRTMESQDEYRSAILIRLKSCDGSASRWLFMTDSRRARSKSERTHDSKRRQERNNDKSEQREMLGDIEYQVRRI